MPARAARVHPRDDQSSIGSIVVPDAALDGAFRDGHVVAVDRLLDDALGVDQHALGGHALPAKGTAKVRRGRLDLTEKLA